jgi:hypothetical protein
MAVVTGRINFICATIVDLPISPVRPKSSFLDIECVESGERSAQMKGERIACGVQDLFPRSEPPTRYN